MSQRRVEPGVRRVGEITIDANDRILTARDALHWVVDGGVVANGRDITLPQGRKLFLGLTGVEDFTVTYNGSGTS